MNEYDLGIVQQAFDHTLSAGAPGLSETIRRALIAAAVLRIRGQLNLPAPAIEQEGEAEGRRLYIRHTDNHPTIHSNRFPAWSELSDTERSEWRQRASTSLASDNCENKT